uniref:NADH-ubiquinone oxidoreductase chain 2 n=1 Tax=Tinodes chinchinus TaxID=2904900 RepID=A0A9E8LPD6_9NEOP|nr:NADH dehydrogenase subunit 2 [Tinodes chinchinus]UZZ44416.1 NADH dehydrogenase subunit 2 [Tinodes chinchinus]
MFMNSSKMIIMMILLMSTLFILSNNSWIISWLMMEINLFSFIPLISNKNSFNSESLMKYFFIQTVCSLMLFLMIMIMMNWTNIKNLIIKFMNLMILMKMGSAPIHYWYIQLIKSLSWMNVFLISTWQKIIPLILLTYNFNLNILLLSIYINSLFSALGGINQVSLRMILGYSSINHLSWMLCSIIINENLLNFYFLIYMFSMMNICLMFFYFNVNYMNQMIYFNNLKLNLMYMLIIFLSMGGLPPFLGFLPKWFMINYLILNNYLFMSLFMIMSSLIVLFFYFNLIHQNLMFKNFKMKWFIEFKNNKSKFIIFYFNFLLLMSIILMLFFYWM